MTRYRWALALSLALTLTALVAASTAGGAHKQRGVSGTISIIAKWTGDEQTSFEAVLAGFKAQNPNVKVDYTGAGDNAPQVISTAIAGGKPPDIGTMPQPGTMADFAKRGALKPITFAKADIAKHYTPDWIKLGTVNGKLYGLFFKGSNKSTVWYNVKTFQNAGVKPATTWPAFLNVAKTIRASGQKAYSIGGADGWTLTDLFENIYLRTAGTAKYDLLTKHKIKWTDPSVKTALTTMAKIVGDTSNINGGKAGALQTDFNTSVSNVFSSSPKAAMVIEADFVPGVVATSNPLKPITGYNYFNFPSINGSKPAVVAGGDIVTMLKDSPAARALIKYLATPQAATIWAKRGGFGSPNKDVKASAYPDALQRKAAVALSHTNPLRYDLSDQQPASFGSTTGQGEWKDFQDFLSNPKNISGVQSELEKDAAKAYKK
jgi:ABC-type glycerol-3-phosphate transport system substrate-binding protein